MGRRKILFASWHFYLDPSNGASITARSLLFELARRGWDVRTYCGASFDYRRSGSSSFAALRRIKTRGRVEVGGDVPFSIVSFRDSSTRRVCGEDVLERTSDGGGIGVDSFLFVPKAAVGRALTPRIGEVWLRFFSETMRSFQPDVVLTYGSYEFGPRLMKIAKEYGARIVVLVQNLSYRGAEWFRYADETIVPSHFAAEFYRKSLGLDFVAIPPLIDENDVLTNQGENAEPDRKYILFVNPEESKGAGIFVKLAEKISKRRSDVPFLLVEGSAGAERLFSFGASQNLVDGLNILPNGVRPRDFYRLTKLTLAPSLVDESFGRVVAESQMNGIPVLTSTAGALPETLGGAGLALPVPERLRAGGFKIPSDTEIEPWVTALERIWDDRSLYEEYSAKGLARAAVWNRDQVGDLYEKILLG